MENQCVELHYLQPPRCDYGAIKARAEVILGEEIDAPNISDAEEVALFIHRNHPISYREGDMPAQTALFTKSTPLRLEEYADDLQQSWCWDDAESVLKRSKGSALLTEMMARLAPPQVRARLFHGVLQAVIECTQPIALVFKHAQQVIDPQAYLAAASDSPILRPGALNVRFYNITNSDGDMLMDTRGLHEIGLHDLQCHFRTLDPHLVSRVLFNTAVYLFEKGAVIESGNTVAGVGAGSKWVCQFEESLLEPVREVLDLNPGEPFAAGNRHVS